MVQGKALQKAEKFAEAIPYFEQAVDYGEGRFGGGHPKLAKALEWLANAHRQARNLEKAGPLYKRALEIWQKTRGPGHPKVGKILNSLGTLYRKQGRYGEEEKTLKRSLKVLENKLRKEPPNTRRPSNNWEAFIENWAVSKRRKRSSSKPWPFVNGARGLNTKTSGSRSTTWPTFTAKLAGMRKPRISTPGRWRSGKRP